MRYPKLYVDDPEPELDEVITPRSEWAEDHCDGCLRKAAVVVTLSRGEGVEPAKFRLCIDHGRNVVQAGGEVVTRG